MWAGQGAQGRVLVNVGHESFVFTTGLALELRDSCVVGTAAAAGIPSFAGPMLSLMVRTSCDARGWSRQESVGAGSGCDGPGSEAGGPCCSPEPLVAAVVETSSRLEMSVGTSAMGGKQAALRIGRRRRGGHPRWVPRVGLFSPTPQGNHLGKVIGA